jgi:hypothetical protein
MKYGIYIVDGNFGRKELWCWLPTQCFETPSFHYVGFFERLVDCPRHCRYKHADKSELVLNFKKHNAKFLTDDRKTIKFLFFNGFGSRFVYPLIEERINNSTITKQQLKGLCKRANKLNWLEFRNFGWLKKRLAGWQLTILEAIDAANVAHGGKSLYNSLFAD